MNEQENIFSAEASSDENAAPIRRRARRTVAPFSPVSPTPVAPGEEVSSLENEISSPLEKEEKEASDAALSQKASTKEEKDGSALSGAGNFFDWIKSFLLSLTAVIFIFTLIFRGVTVSGGSMLPTLENGEYLIISDLFYAPKTGDIVVVQSPNYKNGTEPLIKRVIATGGQVIKINFYTWQVWVDGVELEEDYILFEPDITMNCEDLEVDAQGFAEFVVDENCVFVMGDHRNDSLDSRSDAVGQIDERYIMGRVLIRVTPLSKFGKVE